MINLGIPCETEIVEFLKTYYAADPSAIGTEPLYIERHLHSQLSGTALFAKIKEAIDLYFSSQPQPLNGARFFITPAGIYKSDGPYSTRIAKWELKLSASAQAELESRLAMISAVRRLRRETEILNLKLGISG